ncbi:MAG: electron transfer flavoprotein subunit alpha/FixB family protein [Magnetococcales bacterium]|nr:electron transfer flavoprotein subunit alpha/FixB family protein [Magnetococcales bacterium]
MAVLLLAEAEGLRQEGDSRLDRLVAAMAPLGEVTVLWLGEVAGQVLPHWQPVVAHWSLSSAGAEGVCPEAVAAWLVGQVEPFSYLAMADSPLGVTLLPRVAALLARPMLTGVQRICSADTFVLPRLSGHMLATVQVSGLPVCLTLQPFAFAAQPREAAPAPPLHRFTCPPWPGGATLLQRTPLQNNDRPELATARRVVAGGGGLIAGGSFALIETLAERLSAAVGASRAAVDAGLQPSTAQIGQTGQVIAPDLYIGIGISGSIPHLAGIKQAKTIVAINSDPLAPLMQIADWSLQGDLYQLLPEWLQGTE